ncbi:putative ribonuclease T2 [Trichinella spiralis]|uniref:putative ribonuclease T2 n=1 Tax=Trichinella spiralis TaxID=6334 RepID=UPI0001EFD0FE|nr:putative ribonuclease T2 [Trichinella spiralis]
MSNKCEEAFFFCKFSAICEMNCAINSSNRSTCPTMISNYQIGKLCSYSTADSFGQWSTRMKGTNPACHCVNIPTPPYIGVCHTEAWWGKIVKTKDEEEIISLRHFKLINDIYSLNMLYSNKWIKDKYQ